MKRSILVMAIILSVANVVWADPFGTGDNQFTIDFVNISGDASSANGTAIGPGKTFSNPSNDYRMGKFEITNDQWNKYASSTAGTERPAVYTSWFEAAQFVNYLNTSTGNQAAYKFDGSTFSVWGPEDSGYDSDNPYRNSEAFYFIPTEDEWVKAAYWNGTSLQTYATTDGLSPIAGVDTNYDNAIGNPWDVGSGSEELNGTFDMMGNVWEWSESSYHQDFGLSSTRVTRGGGYGYYLSGMLSRTYRSGGSPSEEHAFIGFRVASVAEPSIDSIISFILDSIDANSLQGEGAGNSADNKLNAFISKIDMAAFLIDAGDPNSIIEACGELQAAYKKCDGLKSPKDFVSGDAREQLAGMILDLIEELGCE